MKQINHKFRQRESGLSLVELMVAMVLGLVVISAVFNTYLGSTRSARFSTGVQQVQENGRYGITTMQRAIRLAGYTPDNDIADPIDIDGSSYKKIAIRLKDTYDCNGELTDGVDGIAVNSYTFNVDTQTISCRGNVGQESMVVVENVEQMRFLWGIDTDYDGVPEKYIPYETTINSSEVVAMRVGMLIASEEEIRSRANQEKHALLDKEYTTEDKKARHVFTTTVMLRNKQ